jgi:hypothetical protein
MSDIELVIKIPKRVYNYIRKYEHIANSDILDIKDAIINGILLPKGHGRLFDERDIVSSNYEVIGNRIYELEPIIDADKEHKHE